MQITSSPRNQLMWPRKKKPRKIKGKRSTIGAMEDGFALTLTEEDLYIKTIVACLSKGMKNPHNKNYENIIGFTLSSVVELQKKRKRKRKTKRNTSNQTQKAN